VPSESAILAEGEFDTVLLWKEVGDLIGAATLRDERTRARSSRLA
jgi:hypothetical protein